MNKITDVTRENIFYMIREGFDISYDVERIDLYERIYYEEENKRVIVPYHGKLEPIRFFKRIYNLDELPSTDSRFDSATADIHQHTVNNDDWSKYFFINYTPFGLESGDDEVLLKFMCEIFHPAVRDEGTPWQELLRQINELLKYDGYELISGAAISGKHPYIYQEVVSGYIADAIKNIANTSFSSDYINSHLKSMRNSLQENPSDSIGKAKELLESCCKTILEKKERTVDNNWSVQKLTKETAKILKLTPDNIENEKKASETIKQILGNLSAISGGMADLRNSYGSGHGKKHNFKGLSLRHAKLAVGASIMVVEFLWDTYLEQTGKDK